jgi:DNA-binding protein H-NS
MASYKELQEQITELQKQAEQARLQEIDGAVKQIRALMQQYGITSDDLLNQASGPKKKSAKSKPATVQFQDGDKTWSGRGRVPGWLKGKDKEQFRVK